MSRKLKIVRGAGNVFADIGFDKGEAENLKLRAELMMRMTVGMAGGQIEAGHSVDEILTDLPLP